MTPREGCSVRTPSLNNNKRQEISIPKDAQIPMYKHK
jgi:hypothetical protein